MKEEQLKESREKVDAVEKSMKKKFSKIYSRLIKDETIHMKSSDISDSLTNHIINGR